MGRTEDQTSPVYAHRANMVNTENRPNCYRCRCRSVGNLFTVGTDAEKKNKRTPSPSAREHIHKHMINRKSCLHFTTHKRLHYKTAAGPSRGKLETACDETSPTSWRRPARAWLVEVGYVQVWQSVTQFVDKQTRNSSRRTDERTDKRTNMQTNSILYAPRYHEVF